MFSCLATHHYGMRTATQDLLEEISDLKRTLGAVKAREADAKAALSMEATMVNKRVKDLQLQLNDADERQRELVRVRRALKRRTNELADQERLMESKLALQQKVRSSGAVFGSRVDDCFLFRTAVLTLIIVRSKNPCERSCKKLRFAQLKNMRD